MHLRTAIKIQRTVEDRMDFNRHWKATTVLKSRTICRRRDRRHPYDRRIPYMPSDEELTERGLLSLTILADALIDDEDERETVKRAIWS